MAAIRLKPLDLAAIAAFLAYSASALVTPIALWHITRQLGLSMSQAGAIELSRSSLILVVLVASGFLAARWGKAWTLGAGLMLLGLGLGVYALAANYPMLLAAAAMMGLGAGVIEGLVNPLVQDLHPDDSGRYLNLVNGFWSVGVLVTVLISGDLLTRGVSWQLLAGALGVYSLLTGAAFLVLRRVSPPPKHRARDVLGHKGRILVQGAFWILAGTMFLAGAAEGAYTFWSATWIQEQHGGEAREGGIGTACFAGGMVLGRFAGGYLVGQRRLRRLILLSAGAGAVVSAAVPFAGSLASVYVVLAAAGLTVACFWPSLQSYAADRMDVDSTSLFILLSCAGIPGFAFASWIIGVLADAVGLGAALLLVPVFFLLLIALMLLERRRRSGSPARPAGAAAPTGDSPVGPASSPSAP